MNIAEVVFSIGCKILKIQIPSDDNTCEKHVLKTQYNGMNAF